jgi:hypothetical protein
LKHAEDFTGEAYELLCKCLGSSDPVTAYMMRVVTDALFEAYRIGIEDFTLRRNRREDARNEI